jgi:DNA-binding response OmpR family regulator
MPTPDGRIRVLMVEDNKEHLNLCREALPPKEFAIEGSLTGGQSLKMLESNDYDIVVLDYRLPDIQGIDLLVRMRAIDKDVPIVFVSAMDDPDLSMKVMRAGACDFIIKRFQYYTTLPQRLKDNLDWCSVEGR